MKLKINGKFFELPEGKKLCDFARESGLDPKRCVAEVNGRALGREEFQNYVLIENDVVEIMQLVAGG